ncbi:MAG: DegT/DnrJ/EryC1/StrS family aminotransferase [Ignavibacteriae bacterium]|nr:DegT/DnrJ/EryC1/StrS family aminotransferase [Ignavibacteriota bacterium]
MNFFNTNISEESKKLVNDTLKSTFISAGKIAEKFEIKFSEVFGIKNPVSLNSGTSALHLGLILAGVNEGDEVILPAQTFISTGLSVLYQKAKPVFADIQYETGNIDPASIEKKITGKTKVIMPVHWAGYPCDMDEIKAIARKYNLVVLEDAAHGLGATYKGKSIGALSEFTVFSFQAIKHITTGDGGVLCCLDKGDERRAKRLRWFDIDRENSVASILGEREYDATEIGYKYHMNDLSAAVGLGNLSIVKDILKKHRKIAKSYTEEFKNISGIRLLDYKNDRESSYWFFNILVEKRNNFIAALKSRGVPSSVVHLRIDKNSVFGGENKGLINQKKFNEHQVSLPVHFGLTDDNIELVIDSVKKGW